MDKQKMQTPTRRRQEERKIKYQSVEKFQGGKVEWFSRGCEKFWVLIFHLMDVVDSLVPNYFISDFFRVCVWEKFQNRTAKFSTFREVEVNFV